MKITRISETKKGRFALFSDEVFLFSVDDETLSRYDLHENSMLSDAEFLAMQQMSETHKTQERAMRLLARRAHSCMELRDKLLQFHDEMSVEKVIEDLLDRKLLDDGAFASSRAGYLSEQGRSRREIAGRLRAAGVDRDHVEDALNELQTDETETVQNLIRRKYYHKLIAGQRENVIAAMARRGFSQHDVLKALEWIEQE